MNQQWPHILNFLEYLGVSLLLLAIGITIFLLTTPYKDINLIWGGASADPAEANAGTAAAHDLGGKILALCIVLASAIYHSLNLFELAVWGLIAIVVQVAVFYLFEWFTPFKVIKEIPNGNVSVGIFSSRLSIGAGLIIASLIS